MSGGASVPLSASGTTSPATVVLAKVNVYFQVYPGTNTLNGTAIGIDSVPYTIDGLSGGITDADGKIEVTVPVGGKAILKIFGTEFEVTARSTLEPVTQLRGQQRRLEMVGYDIGSSGVDGSMGKVTEKALVDFQCDAGVDINGQAGTKTQHALQSVSWAGE